MGRCYLVWAGFYLTAIILLLSSGCTPPATAPADPAIITLPATKIPTAIPVPTFTFTPAPTASHADARA